MTDLCQIAVLPALEVRRTIRELAFAYVERCFDVSHRELVSPSQLRHAVHARFAFAWIIRRYRPQIGSNQIGRWLGRDHSTVISAIRRADELIASDENFGNYIHDYR